MNFLNVLVIIVVLGIVGCSPKLELDPREVLVAQKRLQNDSNTGILPGRDNSNDLIGQEQKRRQQIIENFFPAQRIKNNIKEVERLMANTHGKELRQLQEIHGKLMSQLYVVQNQKEIQQRKDEIAYNKRIQSVLDEADPTRRHERRIEELKQLQKENSHLASEIQKVIDKEKEAIEQIK